MTGAHSTLGIITRAVFRLHPMPQESKTLTFSFLNREKANEFMLAITDSVVVPTGLQMRTGAAGHVAVDVRIDGIAAGVAAQTETVCKVAGDVRGDVSPLEAGFDPWLAREQLWNSGASATICKLSMLPTQLSATAEFIREALADNADWTLLMHSTGLAWLQLDATDCAQVADFISSIRAFLAPAGGTAVVLKAPPPVRQKVDLWGPAGSALPLMKRIKEQFDPRGILNRARFLGGI
jgi:glycolate oxidase FAD binding subunit